MAVWCVHCSSGAQEVVPLAPWAGSMAVPSGIHAYSEPSSALTLEHARSTGEARRAQRQMLHHRLSSFSVSRYVTAETSQTGGLKWLDLDAVEQRYLLTAAADTTVEAFDIVTSQATSGGHQQQHLKPVFTLKRGHPSAHRYQVTSICWYPVDTGLFVTGSADQHVKVWDTNMLEVACDFECPDKVHSVAMSSFATSHALIAVATKNPLVQLADVVSGGFTHTLTGHRTAVWSVCWSPANGYHIYTGDASGEVRLWDVRRSGCRAMLDMNATQRPRPAASRVEQRSLDGGAARFVSTAARLYTSAGPTDTSAGTRGIKRPAAVEASDRPDDPYSDGERPASAARALAHEGPVTGIVATADGLNLVTAAADNRVRLWDSQYHHNRLVHFANTYNRGAYPKRLSSTSDGRYLFYPRGDDIQVWAIDTAHDHD
eukprot:GHUV01022514.1.p1 GENE.GHUV01022514.1~~GHUV01022514.1.p1  ORF type:complete len:430 (+),score=57.87 GHUV01022514.1:30-1319(+)